MNEETTYYEDILFEKLTKDKDRRRNILIDLNVALQKISKVVASIKDFREIQEYKIAVVSVENELHEIEKENQQLKKQLQKKEDIINKISKKCNKEKGRIDFDIFIKLNEQLKTLEGFAKKIDYNLHPIITEAYKCDIRNSIDDLCKTLRYDVVYKDSIKEILDNKGDENNGL